MKRTSAVELAAVFAVVAFIAYFLLRHYYDSIPPVRYQVGLPIAGLAIGELIVARRIRLAVCHNPDAKPMAAILIARCIALGKASAIVGAAMTGAAFALVVKVLPDVSTVTAARNDLQAGAVIFVASVLLVVAGVRLERSGLIPRDPGATQVHR